MMQCNPERLAMSLSCPYTWLAGVTYPAPGWTGYETKQLGTVPAIEDRRNTPFSSLVPSPNFPPERKSEWK